MTTHRTGTAALVLAALVMALTGVAASPAPGLTVLTASTESELQAAFSTDDTVEVTLLTDISLTCGPGGVDDLDRTSQFPITVFGDGHTITQTCTGYGIVENTDFRAVLTFHDTTLTGGDKRDGIVHSIQAGGGAIASGGPVNIIDSVITGNSSATFPGGGQGGAIFNGTSGSDITITRSWITDNDAESNGGAISATTFSNVIIVESTLSDNTANLAGFAFNGGAVVAQTNVFVTNSTVTGNEVLPGTDGASGGGIAAMTVTLVYATIVDNTAPAFANVGAGDLVSFGSVVALPHGSTNCTIAASTTSNGWNFSDDASCGFTGTGDTEDGGDPLLGALGDNGGPTPTRLPASGSALLDRIPVESCGGPDGDIATDQRGVTRPQGEGCDIGAVEVEVLTPPPIVTLPPVVTPTFTG